MSPLPLRTPAVFSNVAKTQIQVTATLLFERGRKVKTRTPFGSYKQCKCVKNMQADQHQHASAGVKLQACEQLSSVLLKWILSALKIIWHLKNVVMSVLGLREPWICKWHLLQTELHYPADIAVKSAAMQVLLACMAVGIKVGWCWYMWEPCG